jgi:methionyl-tRNA formyltransferase
VSAALRVALFGSGSPASVLAAEALADRLVAVVVPAGPRPLGLRRARRAFARARARRELERVAGNRGWPVLRHAGGDAVVETALRRLAPDLLVVATYPFLLSPALLALAPRGGLGLHPALLPRHRGPDPLLWTYLSDDAQAGVTAFWLDEGCDTGPVCAQEALALERGRPLRDLYAELARRGAALLRRCVAEAEEGRAARCAQDPARATEAPRWPEPWALDLTGWGAERAWHVLRGAGEGRRIAARPGGPTLRVGRVEGFVLAAGSPPGTLEDDAPPLARLWCRDGYVEIEAAPLWGWRRG